MEVLIAAAKFWTLFYASVVILNLFTKVQSRSGVGNQTTEKCPQRCTCDTDSKTVNCMNAGFKLVPSDISPDTRSLILDGNIFRHLRGSSFRNLHSLSNLSLRNCQINQIHAAAFEPFSDTLRALWMSNNTLTKKKYKFPSSMRNIELLDMSATGRKNYHDIYHRLFNLKYLYLANNFISAFPPSLPSSTLTVLDVSQNILKNFSFNILSKQYLNVKTLRLGVNSIGKLENNSFLHFRNLEHLDLSYNQISEAQPLAFRSKSLKYINLYGTNFRLDQNNWNIFHEVPNIERINMSFCRFKYGNLTRSAFRDLRKLTELDLSGTEIASLSRVFSNLPNLERLRLSSNPMSTLEGADLKGVEDSLRELDVSSGRLSTISFESLPLKVWKNLKVVDFSDNPFLCDCNFIWLRHWLTRANASQVKVRGWNNYYCLTSKGQVNMFKLNRPSDTDCFQDPLFEDPCIVVLLLLTLLIWITASSASAVHRFRWHLRYWYFMKTVSSLNYIYILCNL